MRITESVEHAATPEQVFTAFGDEGYQVLKCERSGSLEHDVVIEIEDGRIEKAVAPVLVRAIRLEGKVVREWLDRPA